MTVVSRLVSLALSAMLAPRLPIAASRCPTGTTADTVPGDVNRLQIGQSRSEDLGGDPVTLCGPTRGRRVGLPRSWCYRGSRVCRRGRRSADRPGSSLEQKALHRGPGLDQTAIDAEVFARQRPADLRLIQHLMSARNSAVTSPAAADHGSSRRSNGPTPGRRCRENRTPAAALPAAAARAGSMGVRSGHRGHGGPGTDSSAPH